MFLVNSLTLEFSIRLKPGIIVTRLLNIKSTLFNSNINERVNESKWLDKHARFINILDIDQCNNGC